MDFKDCIKFANESGFYYHTGTAKSVYKQLKNTPEDLGSEIYAVRSL